MKNKGKSVVGLLLLLVLCLSLCAVSVIGADNTVAQADSETEISLSGIQMRGAINGWYYYLVLQSDGYNDLSSVESIADGTTILTSDKIKLYTSAEDSGTTLTDLTVQHVDQSFSGWTSGLFVNFAKYDSTHGGHQVYKVVVEKGCKLPYVKDGVVGTYVVDAEYTFVNQNYGDESVKLGAFNWTKTITPAETKETISLDGVQLRGLADLPDNSWYHYFVVTSAAFSGMAANEDNVEITTFATTLDKIKLYTVDSNGQLATKTLAELGVNHTERNKWGANGLFFAFDMFKNGYDGTTVYKVTIEKDCTLVADKGIVFKKFVVDKDYTFYNSSYGNADSKFGALTWTTTPTIPYGTEETEIALDGVQLRGIPGDDSWYHYFVMLSDAYNNVAATENVANALTYSDLSGVKLYTVSDGQLVCKTLAELNANHVEINKWGAVGAFVAFGDYKNGYDGTTVYKVEVAKGTKILATVGETAKVFVVDKDYTFYNSSYGNADNKFGALSWTTTPTIAYRTDDNKVEATIGLEDWGETGFVQFRTNGTEKYFAILSSVFQDLDTTTIANFASNFDKVVFYTVSNGQLVAHKMSDLGVNELKLKYWGCPAAFFSMASVDDVFGCKTYKVVIESGLEIVGQTVVNADGTATRTIYKVANDYTLYNKGWATDGDATVEQNNWTTAPTLAYKSEETTISLDGVQLRGLDGDLATDPWYHYLVLLSSAYDQLGADIEELAQGLVWSKLDGVKLYIVDGNGALVGKTLAELNANHVGLNKWGTKGAFIGFGDYVNGYDGTNVFKIEIAKGTKLLAEIGETAKVFVVDGDYVFCNIQCGTDTVKYGAYKWLDYVPETETITIDGVQMRGMDGTDYSWYRYLVLLSANYAKYGFAENGADTIDQFYADKIKLYLSATDSGKTLAGLGAKHIDQTFQNWSVGAYINFDNYADYNGSTVYKVTIESGCRIPVSKDGKWVWLYVDKDYTFYNVGYGDSAKAYGSFEWWTTPVPDSVENSGDIKVVNVTNQSDGVTRWLILWFNDKFVGTTNATFFETKQFVNVLDNVLIYSGNDLSQTPVTLRSIFDGTITIGQFGSPDAIGFTIKNDVKFDGSNMYIVVVKNGCEMPYVKDGVYSKRTVTADTTFINDNFGKSGEIPGSTGADKRTYEDWCIEWTPAVFVTYKVVGVDKTLDKVCLPIGEIISADKFAVDGYDVTITDNIGYTYYGQIVLPSVDVEITLTYTQKTPEPTPEPDAKKGCNGVVATSSVIVLLAVAAIAVALVAKKKESC
mgnify:FL=1